MSQRLRFAIFGNIYQAQKSVSVHKLLSCLEEREAEILIDKPLYDFLSQEKDLSSPYISTIEGSDFSADYAVVMGGDGTFLEAAWRVGNKNIPILGINMGRLGFLADFSPEEIEDAILQLYEKELRIEKHSVIQVEYSEGAPMVYPCALNEVAILKRDNSSMISIRVEINGEYLTTYQADGLIVNTPTGSTGYALSVGGPIMVSGSCTLGIVPVAPHSLTIRPISVCDDVTVSLSVESRNHSFLVAIDGRSEACSDQIRLSIQKAPYEILVLKRSSGSFFQTLRDKLMWGSDIRLQK